MRILHSVLPILAVLAPSVAAADDTDVYVPIAYSDETIVLIKVQEDPNRANSALRASRTVRVSQYVYYAEPSFTFENVPVRLTQTEFAIDCARATSRRVESSAYRDLGDRLGRETYSDEWTPIVAGEPMAEMRRLACDGLGTRDAFYTNLRSAIDGLEGLYRAASAE